LRADIAAAVACQFSVLLAAELATDGGERDPAQAQRYDLLLALSGSQRGCAYRPPPVRCMSHVVHEECGSSTDFRKAGSLSARSNEGAKEEPVRWKTVRGSFFRRNRSLE
jgi:hypothetical protein